MKEILLVDDRSRPRRLLLFDATKEHQPALNDLASTRHQLAPADMPQSTLRTAPFTYDAASDSSHTMARAHSSGSPMRPAGMRARIIASASAGAAGFMARNTPSSIGVRC